MNILTCRQMLTSVACVSSLKFFKNVVSSGPCSFSRVLLCLWIFGHWMSIDLFPRHISFLWHDHKALKPIKWCNTFHFQRSFNDFYYYLFLLFSDILHPIIYTSQLLPFKKIRDNILCIQDWPQNHYICKHDFELLIILLVLFMLLACKLVPLWR